MANRTLRRTRKPAASDTGTTLTSGEPVEQPGTVAGTDDSISRADGTEPDTDGASADDTSTDDGVTRSGVVEVDPADIDAFIASGGHRTDAEPEPGSEPRQRRKRSPNGTRRSTRKNEAPQDLAPLLNMVHTWAPIMLGIPELAVPPSEQKQLADAYAEFCKHHAVPEVTEKRISEANLVIALCMVYGTRLIAFGKRKQNERKAAAQNTQQPMPQPIRQVM